MSYDITQPEAEANSTSLNSYDKLEKINRTTKKSNFDRTLENLPCRPTVEVYNQLEETFDFINHNIFYAQFGVHLPHVIFSTPRNARFMGFFNHDLWNKETETNTKASEIALNPLFFNNHLEISKTLTHVMMHLAQAKCSDIFGERSKGDLHYHNKSFAQAMIKIGLMPSSTGLEGGAITGVRMSECIIPGGLFDIAVQKYLSGGDKLIWSIPLNASDTASKQADGINSIHGTNAIRDRKRRSKTKYSCSVCELSAWAKPAVHLVCGKCSTRMMEEGNDHQQMHSSSNHDSHPPVIY